MYIDPFDGRNDLAMRRLPRRGSGHVPEDSLARAALPSSSPRDSTSSSMITRERCAGRSPRRSGARAVWGEFETLLLRPRPSWAFALALDLGGHRPAFPELSVLVGCPQEPEWHPEGDVWVHTLQVIDQARLRIDDLPRPQQIAVMLGAVCHDLGKPATTAFLDGRIRSMDHEEQGVAPATSLLDRPSRPVDRRLRRSHAGVLGLVAQHLKPGTVVQGPRGGRRRAFRRLAQKVDLELLAGWRQSRLPRPRPGTFNCDAMDWFLDAGTRLGVEHRPPAADPAGPPRAGARRARPAAGSAEILKAVYEQQSDGTITNAWTERSKRRNGSAYCDGRARCGRAVGIPHLDGSQVQLRELGTDLAAIADGDDQQIAGHEIFLRRRP
jgi:tRNA nucleotidyltransferase (CCA-adding enzyme)